MNQHIHRIIFNAARGVRMAVSEVATSHGKAASGQSTSRCTVLGSVLWAATVGASVVAFSLLLSAPLNAQVIADKAAPKNQQPTVLQSASGTTQVNIQTPSSAGVSRNTYSQFDVNKGGVILNNSRTDTPTQLGGYVQGNPWLAITAEQDLISVGSKFKANGDLTVEGKNSQTFYAARDVQKSDKSVESSSSMLGGMINLGSSTTTDTSSKQVSIASTLESTNAINVRVGNSATFEGADISAKTTTFTKTDPNKTGQLNLNGSVDTTETAHTEKSDNIANTTGANAAANNRLLHDSERQKIKDLAKGDPQKEARLTAAACALVKCYAEYPQGSANYNALKAMADAGSSDAMATERQQLQAQQGLFGYSTQGFLSDQNIDAAKQLNNTYQVATRALGAGQAVLGGLGVAGSVATAPVSCATGVGCVANALVGTLSADAALAGAKQAVSGQPENTSLNATLQSLGLSPEAAGYAEAALGIGAAAKVGSVVIKSVNTEAAANAWARGTYSGQSAIDYDARVYRFADSKYASTTWEIHPGNIASNHRYSEPGVASIYSGTSVQTAAAEIRSYPQLSPFTPKALVAGDVKIEGVLDLTNPAALQALGVTREDIILSSHGGSGAYSATQRIAQWARDQGYNGILAPSAQNRSGTNLITFDSTQVTNLRVSKPTKN